MQLEEGKTYQFLFYKCLDVEGEDFWVLLGPNEKKYLIEAKYYLPYLFKEGEHYDCKIDKINCTGKVFIEPEHPHYQLGKAYVFDVLSEKNIRNSWGDEERLLLVKDVFGRESMVSLPITVNGKVQEQIELKVERIKKGQLYLSVLRNNDSYSHLVKGKTYKFRVVSLATLGPKHEFYLVEDEQKAIHYLRKKFYEDYSFEKNEDIYCAVVNAPEAGKYYLEPLYPGYTIGENYSFEFLREDLYYQTDGSVRDIYIVIDKIGKECNLFYDTDMKPEVLDGKLSAKVLYSLKGKLYLQYPRMADMINDSFDF